MVADTDRQLYPAVATTLEALALEDKDQAAAKLAETYARALDEAKSLEASANAVLRRARSESDGEEDDLLEQVEALRTKLRARTALENLGPKLQAVLVELQATPRARAAGKPGGAGGAKKRGVLEQWTTGRAVSNG